MKGYNMVSNEAQKINLKNQQNASETKPTPPEVVLTNIPESLQHKPQWVSWVYERRGGKWTKVPCQTTRASREYQEKTGLEFYPAKSSDPSTWSRFELISNFYQSHKSMVAGIGIMLQDGLAGIDLDNAIENGIVKPWAEELIEAFCTYTEISPSGTGLKLFFDASLDEVHKTPPFNTWKSLPKKTKYHDGEIEIYDKSSNRYFTVTGRRYGMANLVGNRQEQLNELYEDIFKKEEPFIEDLNTDFPQN